MGGMGAITRAIADAARGRPGCRSATGAQVARILVNVAGRPGGRAGGRHRDRGGTACSPAPTRSGRSSSWSRRRNCPATSAPRSAGSRWTAHAARSYLVLDAEPQVRGMPVDACRCRARCRRTSRSPTHATTMPNEVSWPVPTSCSSTAWSRRRWTPRLPAWLPHDLFRPVPALPAGRGGPGTVRRDELGASWPGLGQFAPNVPAAVIAQVLTPLRRPHRGQHLPRRHRAGRALPRRCPAGPGRRPTPVPGLYLCGAGAAGAAHVCRGYNAAWWVLADLRRERRRPQAPRASSAPPGGVPASAPRHAPRGRRPSAGARGDRRGGCVIGAATAFISLRLAMSVLTARPVPDELPLVRAGADALHVRPRGLSGRARGHVFEAWPDLTGRPGCVRRTGFVRIVYPAGRGRGGAARQLGDAARARRAGRGDRRRRVKEVAPACRPTTSSAARGAERRLRRRGGGGRRSAGRGAGARGAGTARTARIRLDSPTAAG